MEGNQLNKKSLLFLSIFTLFGFSFIAYIILGFSDTYNYSEIFEVTQAFTSTFYGILAGLLTGFLGLSILKAPIFDEVNRFFGKLFKNLDLSWADVLFYSFCAGVGEEILFRGALQPFLGIWPTAIIFVLLHGYINPKNLPRSLYGVYLIFVAAGFGYLMEFFGIYAAITAHFLYDVIMFGFLKKKNENIEMD